VLWDATVQGVPPAGAVLVGLHDDAVWGRAAALPSHRAVVLPQGAAWLTRHLTGARGGSPARVVAVAGAGEMACPDRVAVLVARAACWAGLSTVVVDAHGAGSIAAAMAGARTGAGHRPRAGWVEAAESVRDGSSGGLTATLPELSGAAVLSGSVREVPDPQRGGVVSALRAESDLVVVSLGAVGPDDWLDTPEILMPLGGDEERLLAVSEGPWPQRRSGTSGRGTPSVVTVRTGSSAPDGPEAAAALGGAWAGTVDVRTLRIARGTRRLLKRSWAPRLAAGRPLGEAS
jgi:hypothetical protein